MNACTDVNRVIAHLCASDGFYADLFKKEFEQVKEVTVFQKNSSEYFCSPTVNDRVVNFYPLSVEYGGVTLGRFLTLADVTTMKRVVKLVFDQDNNAFKQP